MRAELTAARARDLRLVDSQERRTGCPGGANLCAPNRKRRLAFVLCNRRSRWLPLAGSHYVSSRLARSRNAKSSNVGHSDVDENGAHNVSRSVEIYAADARRALPRIWRRQHPPGRRLGVARGWQCAARLRTERQGDIGIDAGRAPKPVGGLVGLSGLICSAVA